MPAMLFRLILLLTLVPLLELYLLLRLTQLWGSFMLTVALIVGTGLLGAVLARLEGLRVVARMREQVRRGEMPADSLVDGVMILVSAALLVTPGLITDVVGFLLLIPYTRALIRGMVKEWLRRRVAEGEAAVFGSTDFGPIREEPPEGYPPLEDQDEES
jgi:UPF0716 protein FxsA